MNVFNWLMWFAFGVISGVVVLTMSSNSLFGMVGGFAMFVLFMVLGGMDYFGTRMNNKR